MIKRVFKCKKCHEPVEHFVHGNYTKKEFCEDCLNAARKIRNYRNRAGRKLLNATS